MVIKDSELCPRCYGPMDPLEALSQATNRNTDPVRICVPCENDESIHASDLGWPLPQVDRWPVPPHRHPEYQEDGKWGDHVNMGRGSRAWRNLLADRA